jgi:hypothetical protein
MFSPPRNINEIFFSGVVQRSRAAQLRVPAVRCSSAGAAPE